MSPAPVTPPRPATTRREALGIAGVALLCALLVGLTWQFTRSRIADNEAADIRSELAFVLPRNLYDNAPHRDVALLDTGGGEPLPVYRARRNGAPAAAALTVDAPDGYRGPIRLLVGVDTGGRVLGVHVLAQGETPGIGDAIAGGRPPWVEIFTGRSLTDPPELNWGVRQDYGEFDAIAGATVSSRAVVGGVRRAVQYFVTHRDDIFAAPAQDLR